MEVAEFGKVWIAGRERAKDIWKYAVYDDVGRLTLDEGGIHFEGAAGSELVPWHAIVEICRRKQQRAWALHAALMGLTCLLVFYGELTAGDGFVFAFMKACVFAAAYAILGTAFSDTCMVPWVWVSYRGAEDEIAELWIADAGNLGWRGKSGGTREIFAMIDVRCPASVQSKIGDWDA